MKRELAIAHACVRTHCIIAALMMTAMMVRTRYLNAADTHVQRRIPSKIISFLNFILVHVGIVFVIIKICAILIVFVGFCGVRRRHIFRFSYLIGENSRCDSHHD